MLFAYVHKYYELLLKTFNYSIQAMSEFDKCILYNIIHKNNSFRCANARAYYIYLYRILKVVYLFTPHGT